MKNAYILATTAKHTHHTTHAHDHLYRMNWEESMLIRLALLNFHTKYRPMVGALNHILQVINGHGSHQRPYTHITSSVLTCWSAKVTQNFGDYIYG